jgi:hypothetical protein
MFGGQGQQQQPGIMQSAAPGASANMTPQDALAQAQQIAQQLFPMDGSQRRAQLQQIKSVDQDLYAQVKAQLDQLGSQAKSQGLQGAKQQAAQRPQQ